MYAKKSIITISILFLLFISLFLSSCSAAQSKNLQAVADKIAGYTLPQGYKEQFSVDLMGYQLVSFEGSTPNCHLFLVQAPKDSDIDVEGLKKQAGKLEGDNPNRKVRDVRVVETRTATIRGQEVTLLVGEGINSEDLPFREVTALFEGRNGPAIVNISSPVDLWDWDLVNGFLASIE